MKLTNKQRAEVRKEYRQLKKQGQEPNPLSMNPETYAIWLQVKYRNN